MKANHRLLGSLPLAPAPAAHGAGSALVVTTRNYFLAILAAVTLTVPALHAAALTWDTATGDGAGITEGSGNWNAAAGNLVWNDGTTPNVVWSQTSTTSGSNTATFAGADGTVGQYVVTLSSPMAAQSLAFDSSGYLVTGSTLALINGTANGAIVLAAGKSATVNSILRYNHNVGATITSNSGSVLNLGGGTTASFHPQFNLSGAGTVNLTAGTFTNNIGNFNTAAINLTGGTHAITPGNTNGANIGNAAGQNVNYTVSGTGTLTVNNNATTGTGTGPSWLRLGFGDTGSNEAKLTVQTGGTVTMGSGKYGELQISGSATSNGKLDVQGGTVTIAAGVPTANRIYFFKAGANAGYTATMTQSGGTVTANGIQFGGATGTYDSGSSATLTLSGGNLYLGAQGITVGSAASTLPVSIRLQGGTLGASASWSSSLDMKLGTSTIRAANSGGTAQNITLSGILSDDSGAGTLTKTGAGTLSLSGASDNTFTGATTVSAGTLDLGKVNAVASSSSLTIANGAGLALSSSSSTVPNLTFGGTGTLSFNVAGGYSLTVSGTDAVTNSGAAGSITINLTGTAPANGTYTLIGYSGALQGSGFSAYVLGGTPAGKSYKLKDGINAVQMEVSSAYTWTGAQSSEWSTNFISPAKNWILDGSPADYTNGIAVVFDDTATNKTVDITGADVTPESVLFNSGDYTLQGGNKIAGPAPVTVAPAATLKLGSSNVLPDGSGTGNLTVDGILDLNGNSESINGLLGNGTVDNTAATTTSTLTVGANAGGTFSGTIQNTVGTLALTKTGATDVILSGTNTYSGATTVSQSRLFIASGTAFSPNTAVTVDNGASFVLNATGTPTFNQSITLASGSNLSMRKAATLGSVALPGAGSVVFNYDDVATQAFSLASDVPLGGSLNVQIGGGSGAPGTVTLGGILSGSGGSLVKTGSGRLILRAANTFDGGVTIKNGSLESTTTQTTLGTGTVTMGGSGSSGATFLTGQPNSNPFTINAPDTGSLVIGTNGGGSGFTMSGGITLNGNLTIQTYDNTINGTITARSFFTGGVTGTGNLLLDNLGLAANAISITGTNAVNHNGSITVQGSATGDTTISAPIGANVTGITQNSTTSTLVLSGTNTYAGNTTVNAGTVRITQAPDPANANTGNDASTVTIAATGATLDLAYTGTDKVDKLVIGTTQKAPGVYGKAGSVSPIIGIPQITGDGTLTVASGPAGFSGWITGSFAGGATVPSNQQGANDDPDHDGIPNLVEYAIAGQDPTVGNATIGTFIANTLSFTKRADATGLAYAILESTDLGLTDDWTEVTATPPVYVNDATTISYTLTPGVPAKNFARLRVTQTP